MWPIYHLLWRKRAHAVWNLRQFAPIYPQSPVFKGECIYKRSSFRREREKQNAVLHGLRCDMCVMSNLMALEVDRKVSRNNFSSHAIPAFKIASFIAKRYTWLNSDANTQRKTKGATPGQTREPINMIIERCYSKFFDILS